MLGKLSFISTSHQLRQKLLIFKFYVLRLKLDMILEGWEMNRYTQTEKKYEKWFKEGVRPSQVDNSSGCDPRSGKVGQPPDSKHRAGGGNAKC